MIEVLVSDLGQVVLPFDFSPSREFMEQRCRPQAGAQNETENLWKAFARLHDELGFGAGAMGGREFYQRVVETLHLDATYEEFCRAWSDVFVEDHAVVDLIRRANVTHRFLLSNTNEIHWEWIVANHGEVLSVFNHLFVSQELGSLKPEPAIYRSVEARTGLPPGAHLLIDDLQANIEGARACGWDGIVHTDAAALEGELRRRGLLS